MPVSVIGIELFNVPASVAFSPRHTVATMHNSLDRYTNLRIPTKTRLVKTKQHIAVTKRQVSVLRDK
jgi:hypothetical protein